MFSVVFFKLSHMPDGWGLQQRNKETKGSSLKENDLELIAVIGRLPNAALQLETHSVGFSKVTQTQIQHKSMSLVCFRKRLRSYITYEYLLYKSLLETSQWRICM